MKGDLAESIVRIEAGDTAPESLMRLADGLDKHLRQLSAARADELESVIGRSPFLLLEPIRAAADPKERRAAAEMLAANEGGCACSGDAPPEPTGPQEDEATAALVSRAIAPVLYLRQQSLLP